MSRVLLVTDYAGQLHISPVTNKSYYEGRNKVIKGHKFKIREMSEAEANAEIEKTGGVDQSVLSPSVAARAIENNNAEIANLKARLAEEEEKDQTIADLKAKLEALEKQNSQSKEERQLNEGANDIGKDTADGNTKGKGKKGGADAANNEKLPPLPE